ncbi:MAG: serine--tRNA ligase, partial [Turicibacter sp.]
MLDLKQVRENLQDTINKLETRGGDFSYLNRIAELDEKRKEIILEVETLKSNRNEVSKLIGQYKRDKKDTTELLNQMNGVGETVKTLDEQLRVIDEEIKNILLSTPNVPCGTITVGKDENDNLEIRKYGQPTNFDFEPKPHWDLVTELGIIDFERAGKITGSRFSVYKGLGARLERALISFMLDLHTEEHGYTEILPPFMVNRASMTGTGQLPKFEDDAFKIADTDYFLIPTAEVPVTNLHRDEMMTGEELPIKYTAYSA